MSARLPFARLGGASGSASRRGRLRTPHGLIETPQFMPVATAGSVRAQRVEDLAPAGATMLLANTWHLGASPGVERVAALGGLHRCMGWGGGILTDSGGFQVFSLGEHARVDEAGVHLAHPESGRRAFLSPESSVRDQVALGSDIAMVLDHLVPATVPHAVAADAMERTHRWALRGLQARGDAPTALFAIVQGAGFEDLRRQSTARLTEAPFDGYAIGGLAVGEERALREAVTEQVAAELPADRPRYLMGVGTPLDLLEAVHRGVDLFDCILPTAMAQRGRAYTRLGRVELRRTVYATQDRPLDDGCGCPTCRTTSRAWLHHLFKVREPTAWTLIGLHNLQFWLDLMARVRAALDADRFAALYADERQWLDAQDREHPTEAPVPKRRRPPPPRALGRWELHDNPGFAGAPPFVSVRERVSGEVMHAVTPPEVEARALYVEPARLPVRAREAGPPLVVWDVGLGAGSNAIEVVRAWEEAGGARALELWSFERDLDALRLALSHPDAFPRLRHGGPVTLLAEGVWRSKRAPIVWRLLEGDVLQRMAEAPAPDVVLWDPFSSRTDGELWTLACFRRLAAACQDRPTELYTYSNATPVRVALLCAGFYLAPGAAAGPKTETTVALRSPDGRRLLGTDFLRRWRVSSRRWPADVTPADEPAVEAALLAHPQWVLPPG